MWSFWWKQNRGYPLRWGIGWAVKVRRSKVGGWLPPQNILSRHCEKYLHGMVLKLSGHARNTISLLYKQKTGWNFDIWNFYSEKIDFFFNFGLFSLKIRFLSPAMFENVIVKSSVHWFSWFWYHWKEETLPYTMVPNNHTFSSSWYHPPPLGKPCYKKGLVGQGLTLLKWSVYFHSRWCPGGPRDPTVENLFTQRNFAMKFAPYMYAL